MADSGAYSQGRILWIDPNLADNVMVNPEDLSIKVDFSSYRKGRSILYSGKPPINTAGSDGSVTFIQGSNVNAESTQPSLTTRYTDAIALEVMNTTAENADDFESLGIESIDIEFNTAFVPLIKIKFIDVRGNSILSQGSMSKYRMFFELPYPIFSLKVKGFYGKTVNYCLHMQRWNASFNSETGNFEIQADFMGYTYALLTDLLMGLIRASVRTKKGQEKLKAKQEEYGDNSSLIISIDDMLYKFVELNFTFSKISADDSSASELQAFDDVFDGINNIRIEVDKLSASIYDGNPPNNFFRTTVGDVLCVPSNAETEKKYNDAFSGYTTNLTTLIQTVNSKIGLESLKLNEETLKDVIKTSKITKKEVSDATASDTVIQKSASKYSNDDTGKEKVKILLADIGTLSTSSVAADAIMDIYSLKALYNELNDKKTKLEEEKKTTETNLGDKLSDIASETVGFDPTIRNIFRVLSVNAEIFLEVLKDVSVEAETDASGKRALEFNKISGNINVREVDVKANKIYPWPEYREESTEAGKGYQETWLGSVTSIIPSNINEVVFVEEMLKELLNVAKFDRDLDKMVEEAGAEVDSDPTAIEDPWYPLTVADAPANDLLTKNPYIDVTESGNVDETRRLILLRTFLLIGISAYNNKIEDSLLKIQGILEAENILAASRKWGPNGQTLIASLVNSKTDASELVKDIISFGAKGSSLITNPLGQAERPFFDRISKDALVLKENEINSFAPKDVYYRYTYIARIEDGRTSTYIPINTSFDGSEFYNGNTFKSFSELKSLSSSVLFVSNPANTWNSKDSDGKWINPQNKARGGVNEYFANNDGSLLVKLIEFDTYKSKIMAPDFGSDVVDVYKTGITEPKIRVDSSFDAVIKYDDDPNATLKGVEPLSGNYAALEIDKLNYTPNVYDEYNEYMGEPLWYPNGDDASKNVASSLLAFHVQYSKDWSSDRSPRRTYGGTYVSTNINAKLKEVSALYDDGDKIIYNSSIEDYLTKITGGRAAKSTWFDNGGYMTKQKELINLKIQGSADIYLPFIEFGISTPGGTDNIQGGNFSLFGSYLYYLQSTDYARALLFLHTIPWQGVKNFSDYIQEFMMIDKMKDWWDKTETGDENIENNHYTRVVSIRSMFQANGAFIHAPKAWVLFIGAMLWRIRESAGNENDDPISFYGTLYDYTRVPKGIKLPSVYDFIYLSAKWTQEDTAELNPWGLYIGNDPNEYGYTQEAYVPIDRTLRSLPRQVRDEFIDYFKKWVDDSNGFQYIKQNLELFKGRTAADYTKWVSNCETVNDSRQYIFPYANISRKKLEELFTKEVVDNYALITKLGGTDFTILGNLSTVLKPGTPVMEYMVSLLTTPTIIQNTNPNIWNFDYVLSQGLYEGWGGDEQKRLRTPLGYETYNNSSSKYIRARGDKFEIYLKELFGRLIKLNEDYQKEEILSEEDELQQQIFGTTDDDTIKLLIYRTLSSINDKWLNGSENSSPFSQCGASTTNPVDLKYAKKFRGDAVTEASLIDTFRFVDRAFYDIGDKFYINVNSITSMIRGNYNQSFFDVVNKTLSDNNFNFFTLPTFINFNDITELRTIFTPYSYNDPVTFDGTGPSFVCVYVGQTSVNLDLGTEAVYPDDGLSLQFDSSGALKLPTEASDFNEPYDGASLDYNVPVFSINYGQQNQNYFKSVKLDQREFTETMESLQVIESISQQGDKSKPTYAGNNLFNVYQTRSYSAEVEMLGSAMIQPMMYFQLNNIPMFRGAYLIYKVTHSIKPHNMVTTFKGNRVKKSKTPLMDKATMYMNLVGVAQGGATIGSSRGQQSSGYYTPIISTLIENGSTNGNVSAGNITMKAIPFDKLKGVGDPFNKKNIKKENMLISEAVDPLVNMLNDWITWMKSQGFKGSGGNYAYITSIFRDYDKQVQVKRDEGNAAATPGTSPHGWGIAVDLQFFTKSGSIIPNTKNTPAYFKYGTNPAIQWLYDHSYMYGWISPIGLRDGSGLEEHWHWEYHGTSAKCLVEESPTVYGQKINTSGAIKDFVKNPKDASGKEAVYTSCKTKYVKTGDGTEDYASTGAARADMKVSQLAAGFDVKFKRIITNGNYAGITITDYPNDWLAVTANYIAKSETFTAKPGDDEGTLRAGFGTDKILRNGKLSSVDASTVFTLQEAKNTLAYQVKNTYSAQVIKDLGQSNWNKLNKYQRAALVSLGYNAGSGYIGATDYGKQIKNAITDNNFTEAAQGILNGPITGVKSGLLKGLIRRRKEEARLFLLDKNAQVQYTD